eukprot:gene8970-9901_t
MQTMTMSAMDDASSALSALEEKVFHRLNEAFKLKSTDFSHYQGVSTWQATSADDGLACTGKTDWLEEKLGSKLTGIARYSITKKDHVVYHFDGWLGPSRIVPHLLLSFGYDGQRGYFVETDHLPRGPTPLGSDPSYLEAFYSPSIQAELYDNQLVLGKMANPSQSFALRLLRSPLYLHIEELSFENLERLVERRIALWIDWAMQGQPLDSRLRGGYNARDDKIRQYFFASRLHLYGESYRLEDEIVRRLAAASTGPISEAYVGGFS